MRDYSRIKPALWTGTTGKAIRRLEPIELRLATWSVALHLISNRHANMLGLYELPPAFIQHEIGIGEDLVKDALGVLEHLGFAAYCFESEVVWVRRMAAMQILGHRGAEAGLSENDKRVHHVRRLYRELPDNPFLGPFFEEYADALRLDEKRGESDLDLIPTRIEFDRSTGELREVPQNPQTPKCRTAKAPPSEPEEIIGKGPSVTLTEAKRHDPDAVKHQSGKRSKGVLWGESREWFEQFWETFDYKSAKQAAIGAWLDLERDGEIDAATAEGQILPAARAEAKRRAKLPPDRTPKMAQGWLSERRFQDEALIGEDPNKRRAVEEETAEQRRTETLKNQISNLRGTLKHYGVPLDRYEKEEGESLEDYWQRLDRMVGDVKLANMGPE